MNPAAGREAMPGTDADAVGPQSPEVHAVTTGQMTIATPLGVELQKTDEPQIEAHDPLLVLALQNRVPVETIERLVALRERAEERSAARAYFSAMARFQSDCPPIPKSSNAKITTRQGAGYSYQYAELDEIAATIRPHLHANGLSYTWDSTVSENGAMLTCVCTVRHADGHSVSASFVVPTATSSAMSEQQRYAAALTFAQRKSLVQALGLVTTDATPDAPQEMESITAEQAANLNALLDETQTDRATFLRYAASESVEAIPRNRHAELVGLLERKRAAS